MINTKEYIIKAKIGKGIATYVFDNLEYAMEIVERLKEEGVEFTANFDYE